LGEDQAVEVRLLALVPVALVYPCLLQMVLEGVASHPEEGLMDELL